MGFYEAAESPAIANLASYLTIFNKSVTVRLKDDQREWTLLPSLIERLHEALIQQDSGVAICLLYLSPVAAWAKIVIFPPLFHRGGSVFPKRTTRGGTGDSTMAADVLIENHGSVALFTPMTPDAHQWVEEYVEIEPWQRIGCFIACEPGCLA